MTVEDRLRHLDVSLPEPAVPLGSYATAVRFGNLLYTAGHVPGAVDGRQPLGKVGADLSVEEGAAAARSVGINLLATVKDQLGSLDNVVRVVKVLGFVASAPGFNQQPAVINGFSDLMRDVFGDAGVHARSAVGVGELPNNAPVEIEAILEVK